MVSSYYYYVTSTGETSEAVWENVNTNCTKSNEAIAKPGLTSTGERSEAVQESVKRKRTKSNKAIAKPGLTSTGETSEAVGESMKRKRRKRKGSISKPGLTARGTERIFVKHNYVDRSGEASVYMDDDEEDAIYERYIIFINERKVCSDINEKPDSRRIAPFPLKLHMMLIYIARGHLEHIASWLPHGRAFQIHDIKAFEDRIMNQFFNMKGMDSFKRQLNLYGFTRLTHGPDEGVYYNEYFLRGKPRLTMHLPRIRVKGTKIRAASSPKEEPDLYSMPFVNPNYVFNGVKVGSALMNKLANISEKSLIPSEQRETRSHEN